MSELRPVLECWVPAKLVVNLQFDIASTVDSFKTLHTQDSKSANFSQSSESKLEYMYIYTLSWAPFFP